MATKIEVAKKKGKLMTFDEYVKEVIPPFHAELVECKEGIFILEGYEDFTPVYSKITI